MSIFTFVRRSLHARRRAKGCCCACGCSIGAPPQPFYCDACAEKVSAPRSRSEKPIAEPTFERFEEEERRRGSW